MPITRPGPIPSPPLSIPALPADVAEQFENFAAPQPTLLTVHLDNVTAYIWDSFNLKSAPITGIKGNTNTTTGTTALTVSDGTLLAVGMGVSGAGIPVGATLDSGSGTSWVLSIAATADANNIPLTFTNVTVDLVDLTPPMKPNVPIDTKTTTYNMFPLTVVGDIVGINDDNTVTGIYLSKNFVTTSAAPTAPDTAPPGGTMISDPPIKMVGFRDDIFKMIYQDPLDPTGATFMEIGSITASGVSGQPMPPGQPSVITGGDWAITGGTGAFLGVTGQMGGQGGGTSKGNIRMASVTEDPSQRRNNAKNASSGGPYTGTFGLYVIPMMPPQIIEVFHGETFMPVTQANPATLGETLTLYATGLGPVRDQSGTAVPIGQPFPQNTTVIAPVTVTISNSETIDNDELVLTRATLTPVIAQGCQGFSNGYGVEFMLSDFSPPVLPGGPTTIQISSAWIQSPAIPFYVA